MKVDAVVIATFPSGSVLEMLRGRVLDWRPEPPVEVMDTVAVWAALPEIYPVESPSAKTRARAIRIERAIRPHVGLIFEVPVRLVLMSKTVFRAESV